MLPEDLTAKYQFTPICWTLQELIGEESVEGG
jgi:hypothetical protein